MTAQHLKYHWNIPNFRFDPRRVRQVEETRKITGITPGQVSSSIVHPSLKHRFLDRFGKDKDGAFRVANRLDGRNIV